MEISLDEFFNDFRQELMAGAEANSDFQVAEFVEAVAEELESTGFIDGFEFCHYRAQRGIRVDGYWFNDEGGLDLFVADFDARTDLTSLPPSEVTTILRRVEKFFEASRSKALYRELEETSPEYGLAREISDRGGRIQRVNFFLVSERMLSERLQTLEDGEVDGVPSTYQVWDMSRIHRQRSSRGHKEALDIDLQELFGHGISCLPAHVGEDSMQSYLVVMPGEMLATLYGKYGARLLEQNVRSFLQARGKVNKGIRSTIMSEPERFFAYNNGITATAQEVVTDTGKNGQELIRLKDLQIVNGGQTTASLFHTKRKDKASLDNVFVQMKLSVIDSELAEQVVPKISEYANTQNRVNAADFFSNHPFHVRMEEFSRRIWAPAQQGAQRETKWFYERARGQYADAQSNFTQAEKKRFQAEYPKPQMFSKTDLAKFENVWDEHPRWVNLGAQKNFARYANRIGKEWTKTPDQFNEYYFKRAIARAIVFRKTEKMVSEQPWYNGGYRANIVAYALSSLNEVTARKERSVDFMQIWNIQGLPPVLSEAIRIASKFVNDDIIDPPQGISNISEWCKKEGCWQSLHSKMDELIDLLPEQFWSDQISADEKYDRTKEAKKTQQIDNGIEAQRRVLEVATDQWRRILDQGTVRSILSPKEAGILRVAQQIPARIPTEKQSSILIEILEKAQQEGII